MCLRIDYCICFVLLKIRSCRLKLVTVLVNSRLEVAYLVTRRDSETCSTKLGASPKNTTCGNCGLKFKKILMREFTFSKISGLL